MSESLGDIYTSHHKANRPQNFSVLENERAELLKKYIGQGKKVLDIGCRDGTLTRYFVAGNDVTGADIDREALAKASRNLSIKTTAMDLNGNWNELNGQKFDVIVAGELLEHLYYPSKVIQQASEHLNSDGIFIGSVPNAFSLKHRVRYLFGFKRHTPLSDPTHINQFGYREFENLFKKDFKTIEVLGLGRFARLSQIFKSLIAFDFFFIAKK